MGRKEYVFKDFLNKSKDYNDNHLKEMFKNIKKVIPYEDNYEYWVILCEINLSRNNFEKANDAVNNAIRLNNSSSKVWYLKARTSIGLMNYKKALRASERALSIDDNPEYRELNQNIRRFLNFKPEEIDQHTDEITFKQNYTNKLDNMVTFVSSENIELLKTKKFTRDVYYTILEGVISEGLKNKTISGDIFTKIKQFAECFVNISFKSEGEEHGTYVFNSVQIDARLNTSRKIGAFIHELAHHFLSEIFEQALMYIYDSVKTDTIEAFAWYSISQKPEWLLMNEYCAHTVECYFMPYEGFNYESFNKVIRENFNPDDSKDLERIKKAAVIGNTFAQDIIYMLNKFFTDDLKNEINLQYLKDNLMFARYFGTEYLTNERYVDEYKFDLINMILNDAILDVKLNLSYSQLFYFKNSFKNVNRTL